MFMQEQQPKKSWSRELPSVLKGCNNRPKMTIAIVLTLQEVTLQCTGSDTAMYNVMHCDNYCANVGIFMKRNLEILLLNFIIIRTNVQILYSYTS